MAEFLGLLIVGLLRRFPDADVRISLGSLSYLVRVSVHRRGTMFNYEHDVPRAEYHGISVPDAELARLLEEHIAAQFMAAIPRSHGGNAAG